MTLLLSVVLVLAWGAWMPIAQAVRGVPQAARTFYATVGNLALAGAVLLIGGGHLELGFRQFWLPFLGGLVWTVATYSALRSSEGIGLARAAGSWTPVNIVVAFAWGVALFGELEGFSLARLAVLGVAFLAVIAGVLLVVGSQETAGPQETAGAPGPPLASSSGFYRGVGWAVLAGVLWGSYFVPSQWSRTPAQVSNFPLAIGIFVAGLALMARQRGQVGLGPRATGVQVGAGVLFGIGNVALLGLVSRVGTGTGFTIGQLGLLVNASIGIWVFRRPAPGTRAAHAVMAGILVAGVGGGVIGAVH